MKKIALVFWPRKGSVELNAKRIFETFGEDSIDIFPLKEFNAESISGYNYFIFGCSTVGADAWQDAWSGNQWAKLFLELKNNNTSMTGKKIAIFGLGDQILYPDHYVNEMANLKNEFTALGAEIVGKWPADEYEHTDSKAIEKGFFVGLALDEHNQDDLSIPRIEKWVKELKTEHFHL